LAVVFLLLAGFSGRQAEHAGAGIPNRDEPPMKVDVVPL